MKVRFPQNSVNVRRLLGSRLIRPLIVLTLLCLVTIKPETGFAKSQDTVNLESTYGPASIDQQQTDEIRRLRERLDALETQQSTIVDEIAQRVTLGGYGSLEFEDFDNSGTTFEGKLEVLISGQIHDRIRFYNEIDLGVPNGTSKAEQSYVDFLLSKWINLRGGVMLVPFGKFNLDHFDPRRDLTDRPLVARQITPTTWSDLGVGLFGLAPLSSALKGTYQIAVINGLTDQFSPTNGGLRNARPNLGKDNNGDKAVVGRLTLKFHDQYEIGLSGYRGDGGANSSKDMTGVGADLEFKPRGDPLLEDFELKGEFAHFTIKNSTTLSNLYGAYIQMNYHFWPSLLNETILGQPFNSPTFTLVGRYDHATINRAAGTGNLTEDRFTIGLNYRPIEEYVIKTEYQINNGAIERESQNGFLASVAWLF